MAVLELGRDHDCAETDADIRRGAVSSIDALIRRDMCGHLLALNHLRVA